MTLIIAYLLNIIDYLFTSHWVNLYGLSVEGNPFGKWLFEYNVAGVFKIGVAGVLFAILAQILNENPQYNFVGYILLTVYALIDIYHLFNYFT